MAKNDVHAASGLTPEIIEKLRKVGADPELINDNTAKILVNIDNAINARAIYISTAADTLKEHKLSVTALCKDIGIASTKTIYNHPVVSNYIKLRAEEIQQELKGLLPVPVSGQKVKAALEKAKESEARLKKLSVDLLDQELLQIQMDDLQEENTTLKHRLEDMHVKYAELQNELADYKKAAATNARRGKLTILKRSNQTDPANNDSDKPSK